jgi:16S rRNA C967 or C1407 C5-methylase (RsmB/RsmF family)
VPTHLLQLPLLEAIHEYLKKANDHGSISRQEAVSMVPPLFLDVQPQHKVHHMAWGAEGQGLHWAPGWWGLTQ